MKGTLDRNRKNEKARRKCQSRYQKFAVVNKSFYSDLKNPHLNIEKLSQLFESASLHFEKYHQDHKSRLHQKRAPELDLIKASQRRKNKKCDRD